MTLNQGDIIITGTPSGVGPVKPGDIVEASLSQGNELLASLYHQVEKG